MKKFSKVKILITVLGLIIFFGTIKTVSAEIECLDGSSWVQMYHEGGASDDCIADTYTCGDGSWQFVSTSNGTWDYSNGYAYCNTGTLGSGNTTGISAINASPLYNAIKNYFISVFPDAGSAFNVTQ